MLGKAFIAPCTFVHFTEMRMISFYANRIDPEHFTVSFLLEV